MSILSDLQTRKLGLLELIAMGYNLYLKHFRIFFGLLCIILPFLIIFEALVKLLPSNPILWIIPYMFFGAFYSLVVIPVFTSALAIIAEGYILGENPKLNVAIRRALHLILPLIGLNMRFFIIFYLRLLLLIVPGVIYGINNSYFILALILRDQRGKAAFQYSRSLVKGNWWKVFFFSVLIVLLAYGLQILINKNLGNVIINSPVLVSILSSIISNLAALGVGISAVLLFLNLEFQNR
jgi:hypothetical protein